MDDDLMALLAKLTGNKSPNASSSLNVPYDFLRSTPGNKLWSAMVETPFVQDTLRALHQENAASGSPPLAFSSNPTMLRMRGSGGSTNANAPNEITVAEQAPLTAARGDLANMKVTPEEAMRLILTHEVGHSIDMSHGFDPEDTARRAYGEKGAQLFASSVQGLLSTMQEEDVSFEDVFAKIGELAQAQNIDSGDVEAGAMREITADLLETNLFRDHPVNRKVDFLSNFMHLLNPFAPSQMNILNPER